MACEPREDGIISRSCRLVTRSTGRSFAFRGRKRHLHTPCGAPVAARTRDTVPPRSCIRAARVGAGFCGDRDSETRVSLLVYRPDLFVGTESIAGVLHFSDCASLSALFRRVLRVFDSARFSVEYKMEEKIGNKVLQEWMLGFRMVRVRRRSFTRKFGLPWRRQMIE